MSTGMGTHWDNDEIQFPRLLAEIMATQDSLDMDTLSDSMDLDISDIHELFERAHAEWEAIKRDHAIEVSDQEVT